MSDERSNDLNGKACTYEDYLSIDSDERYELLEGFLVAMPPSPSKLHQTVAFEIGIQVRSFLRGKPCMTYLEPSDVRLDLGCDKDTVVQPDLYVLCDSSEEFPKAIKDIPYFIVEVLSPDTSSRDNGIKKRLYMRNGVQEYWIVDPVEASIEINALINNTYVCETYYHKLKRYLPVECLSGCVIDLDLVFYAF
jgi:Uma2 family endonuclease